MYPKPTNEYNKPLFSATFALIFKTESGPLFVLIRCHSFSICRELLIIMMDYTAALCAVHNNCFADAADVTCINN